MSWFWDLILGCDHQWVWCIGGDSTLKFNSYAGTDVEVTAAICRKCKEVKWKYVRGTL